ncbi:KTSC domain-containing protein [Citrobacter freundii]|uniref:KTSC domain-containing protein n=1 Tax=Citrobacter freundii TaxID=546 RepID=UPI002220DA6E|nr:KTSC domain-containing protein [Citrobacter freundii]MCW0944650.1 KTSC domain-containing protein [Citrobacter freundii]
MNHHPVKSSRIASVGYDESSHTLEIRFHQLATLQYQPVPAVGGQNSWELGGVEMEFLRII